MDDIEVYRIPRHLDDPVRFVLWTADEAAVLLGSFGLCIYLGFLGTGLLISLGLWWLYREVKQGASKYDLLAALYWIFPHWTTCRIPWLRGLPPSSIRFWIG